ncbi:DNA cytosine methyltransferase [Pseudonocardia nematodicida]|uniref:Cytosine-specific methyltransferase n=1 Tax=Pseudonocardia nematodicida TaxID=1206997 RepID=A0ABV1KBA5_9PSEU
MTGVHQHALFETPSSQHEGPSTGKAKFRKRRLKVVDLFAGAGGLSQGFHQAGFQIIGGSDHDPDACATYAGNFPQARTIVGDIRTKATRDEILDVARRADVIVGGPPCQAFSQVRNHSRLIDDPRNSLYREFVQTVDSARPAAFIMENVPGMAQMGVLEQVKQDLSISGAYDLNAQVLDAANFGVPQTRKRLIFFGVRRDLEVSPLMPTGSGATSRLGLRRDAQSYSVVSRSVEDLTILDHLRDTNDLSVVTAAQAISDLEVLESGRRAESIEIAELAEPQSAYQELMRRGLSDELMNVSVPRMNADTVQRLNAVPAGGNHRDLTDELRVRYLSDQRWGPANGSGQLGRAHYYAYRRLHPGMWGWTLNTKADSVYHYATARSLTVREFARLQSFPDHFVVTTDPRRGELTGRISGGAAHSRYRQIGNAVPPLLAMAIAREVSKVVNSALHRAADQ